MKYRMFTLNDDGEAEGFEDFTDGSEQIAIMMKIANLLGKLGKSIKVVKEGEPGYEGE